MRTEKILFIYPSFPSEAIIAAGNIGDPKPILQVAEYPTEFSLLAASGLIGINLEKGYVLSTNVYLDGELATDPEDTPSLVSHSQNISLEGTYVTTFGVPLRVRATKPGIYTLRLSLYEKTKEDEQIFIDEKETQLVISEGWGP